MAGGGVRLAGFIFGGGGPWGAATMDSLRLTWTESECGIQSPGRGVFWLGGAMVLGGGGSALADVRV